MIRKLLLSLTLALFVSGCALTQSFNNPIGTSQLDTIQNTYGAALSLALAYGRLCKDKIIHKSCWNVIEQVQPYQGKAHIAIKNLRKFVKDNPTVDATVIFNTTRQVVQEFKDVLDQNGVK